MDNRNIILAIALSLAIILGWQMVMEHLYPRPPKQEIGEAQVAERPRTDIRPQAPTAEPGAAPTVPGAAPPTAATVMAPGLAREQILAEAPRVRIDTPSLHGSISLVGARLDDLTLANYRETLDPDSPEIVLLSPKGTPQAYYTEAGWTGATAEIPLPQADTLWTADGDELTPETPVTLSWDNGKGLVFKRTFAVDEHYMLTFTQRVENKSDSAVTLHPYALVSRTGTPEVSGFFILHEGPIGVLNDQLKEIDYDELQEAGVMEETSAGGWIGITDKYWLTALIPKQSGALKMRFVHHRPANIDIYQVDYLAEPVTVAPGATGVWEGRTFAGAKVARLLDAYSEAYGIPLFDRAIDFGWFYFLTKPIFYFLTFINSYVGNFGVAILLLTVAIKLVFFPLANKSYRAMSQMRKLQPEMVKLQERFGEDKARLNQERMALFKREKVNPASGCLPILIQIPVFFALYKVLFVTIEMRHAPFFGWIQDLSAPDPTTLFNAFGFIPWTPPEILMIGIWPLIMGATMYLQQKLNPAPPDPLQAKIFMFLPFIFTIMLARFPAGLVVYWTWNNVLSIAQQWVIMRRAGVA